MFRSAERLVTLNLRIKTGAMDLSGAEAGPEFEPGCCTYPSPGPLGGKRNLAPEGTIAALTEREALLLAPFRLRRDEQTGV